jgi:hypothetical protein
MDKLTRYNQKLLAIIGTTIIVGAALAIIFSLLMFIVSIIDFNDSDDNGLQIHNQQTVDGDSSVFKRTQAVTFNEPIQLDTAQAKFVIPVGQVNIKSDKNIDFGSGSELKYSSYEYRYESHFGLYNNFIYFDYSLKSIKKIFSDKIAITQWAFLKIDTIEVLLFKGTTTDDNSDSRMDSDDYQTLFAYFLTDDVIKRYDFEHKTVLGFEPMNKTELVSISLGIDENKDFNFERNSESQEITTLNVRTRNIQEIVSNGLKSEIQYIIDGIKK